MYGHSFLSVFHKAQCFLLNHPSGKQSQNMTDANVQRESILSAISDVISLVFFISTGFGLIV